MRIALIYMGAFALCLTLLGMIRTSSTTPESVILGNWEEVDWKFERTDKATKNSVASQENAVKYVKDVMAQHLVIHEAEHWEFRPNGELILRGDGYEKCVDWCIKGRGHILQIKYDDGGTEHYNITELEDGRLILNFDSDVQARGIARLEFVKKSE